MFFFPSRRRHTRYIGDWSSDVCSSDLRVSIFSPATACEREENFESYWLYQQRRDGEILEDTKDLSEKRKSLTRFRAHVVRTRRPVPEAFHRNCLTMRDDPQSLDRRTLLLTFLYKF